MPNLDRDGNARGPHASGLDYHPYPNKSVFVDGLKLNYVSAGSGRPVVLIHGNPGSYHDYTLSVVGTLSQSYHVVAFDRPGHGDSGRHDSEDTTVEVQARIIHDALGKLRIERPVLVGHSWGGSLVLAAAVAYETELSAIVLLAPAAYPFVIEWWSFLPHVPFLGPLLVKTLTPLIGRAIVKESLKEAYHPQSVHEEYAQQSAEMWTRPGQVRACAADERTLGASLMALSGRYSEIHIPVVILTGTDDLLLDPKKHAYRLHKAIKHSQLKVLPQTGHQLPQTRSDAVIESIEMAWRAADERDGNPNCSE